MSANTQICRFWDRDTLLSDPVVRANRNRTGYISPKRFKGIRANLQSVPERDRARYLLEVLEQVSWINPQIDHPTDCIGAANGTERQLLRLLYDCMGRPVSGDALLASMYALRNDPDRVPDMVSLRVYVRRIRKALSGHPWRIETIWGVGYRMVEIDR